MPKTIFHLDMNAYFASVEQACNPFIRNKPVAVVSSLDYSGAAILARSYEAKKFGVQSFSRVREALVVCPDLITVPLDHLKYYDVNQQIFKILQRYTPLIEIYSIDEFFLDMTSYFNLHLHSPLEIARQIKQEIKREINIALTCSIGVSCNKLLAKVGSDFLKPDGLTCISWEDRYAYLDKMPLEDIWGIGRHCVPKLKRLGVHTTADIRGLDINILTPLVGSYAHRLKQIAQGEDFDSVSAERNERAQKSMQHAHTLKQATSEEEELRTLVRKQSERLARRLRRHGQLAGKVSVGMRGVGEQHYGWGVVPKLFADRKLLFPSNSGLDIYRMALNLLTESRPANLALRFLVIGVSELTSNQQSRMFVSPRPKMQLLESAIDKINHRYGEFTVRSLDILHQRIKERKLSVHRLPMTFHPD